MKRSDREGLKENKVKFRFPRRFKKHLNGDRPTVVKKKVMRKPKTRLFDKRVALMRGSAVILEILPTVCHNREFITETV